MNHDLIRDKIRAGYPGLFLITHEEGRAESALAAIAGELDYQIHAWSISAGRLDVTLGTAHEEDVLQVLNHVAAMREKSLLILRDFDDMLAESNPLVNRTLKDALLLAKSANKTIVMLGSAIKLPASVEKLVSIIDLPLPSRDELRTVLTTLCTTNERPVPPESETDFIIDSLGGMTTHEAEDALSLSIIEADRFDPAVLFREKSNVVKKNGLLEIVEVDVKPEDIGGLENLMEDLLSKRNAFSQEARDYGLPSPRGVLAVGQPGTGKSLCAQATKNILKVPLLRLDAGKIFASHVGESEANWRSAFATAKAISPCILWIDEVDGLFSGAKSSGQTDGGTTNRVIKAVLQDMQFNGEGLFFMFTANDIDGLPDPLIDRLDVWGVDLPTQAERAQIWSIHIKKRKRDPRAFNLTSLAVLTAGYSGRQIEQMWLKAMTLAFNDGGREPGMADIEAAATKFVATSVTMGDAIEARRKRLAHRATPASRPEITTLKVSKAPGRKLAA